MLAESSKAPAASSGL